MQGHDIERYKVDDTTWKCKCAWCGTWFESRRDDASFCPGGKCRSAYHRHKVKTMKYLKMMVDLSAWVDDIVKCDHSFATVQQLHLVAARCKSGVQRIVNEADYTQGEMFMERDFSDERDVS